MTTDSNSLTQQVNRDVYAKFNAAQTQAINEIDTLIARMDEQGSTYSASELQKVKKTLANTQVRVIRLFHTYSEENE